MKFFNLVCKRAIIIYGTMGIVGGLTVLTPNYARAADQAPPVSKKENASSSSKPSMKKLKSWRSSIMHVPLPKKGCFKAGYPKNEWQEVPCTKAPLVPFRPARGPIPEQIGNGNDTTAGVADTISEAIGSFDSVTNVVNVYGINYNNQQLEPNIFSLQLNSQFFSGTPACNGIADCLGWGQFVYDNLAGQAYIQFWLINYGATCPSSGGPATGWFSDGENDCFGNSNAVTVTNSPPIDVSELSTMSVVGNANAGNNDNLIFYVDSTAYSTSDSDSVVSLATYWQQAEFNVFGDGNGTEATFNLNSPVVASLQVRTAVDHGNIGAPSCIAAGYTGETNNLYFGGAPTNPTSGNKPALVFTETSTNNNYSACEFAASVGDTHLTTFTGLRYDFQATGDFLLVDDGSDFIVQTRQAPPADDSWKDTTINTAVAVQMGKTRVALYAGRPARLLINGKPYTIPNGQKQIVENGGQIYRMINDDYLIISPSGNSVRALLYNLGPNAWMNVTVGLGHSKGETRGLLGNLKGNENELVTSRGTVLKSPVSFNDLYKIYGESWRVQPNEMLLEPEPMLKPGIPEKPFYVSDLKPEEAARAIAICKAASIVEPALLEACALDTAVLGGDKKTTVKAYINAVAPRAVLPRPSLEIEANASQAGH